MYEKKCYTDEEFISMKLSKIARILELNHYKNAFLFFIKHPIKFIKRLSMFMKLSIGWTVISTVFGFVVFGLVARDLVIEKSKNTKLTSDFQKVQQDLLKIQNSSEYKIAKGVGSDLNESKKLLSDSILLYEKILTLPNNHKKIPDFKNKLQKAISYLRTQNNMKAKSELEQLSKDLASEKIASQ